VHITSRRILFSPGISISLSGTTKLTKERRNQENKKGRTERRKKNKHKINRESGIKEGENK
jgi:hypothetical protein